MPTIHVHVHPPGRPEPIPGQLTTASFASSYGEPVLLLRGSDAGVSFDSGEIIAHGPIDVTRWGAACTLPLEPVDPREETHRLLVRWRHACAAWRDAYGLEVAGGEVAR